MKIAIVGSREDHEERREFIYSKIDEFVANLPGAFTIVSGGAPGVDSMAKDYARLHDIPTEIFPADWRRLGKSAGPLRNSQIVATADVVIAFPDKKSVGTWDTVNKALRAKKPVYIVPLASIVFNGAKA